MNTIHLLAQATRMVENAAPATSTTSPTTPPPGWAQLLSGPMFPLLLGILVLYLFVFRSKKGQEKKRETMLAQLERGDRVQTIGGIIGTVVEARENEVLLKVDESSNTKIRFSRNAIHRVLEEEKAEK